MNFEDAFTAIGAGLTALFALGLVSGVCFVCLSRAFQRAWRARQSQDAGDVLFAVFGAVALADLIGASALTTMKGPIAALTTSNRLAAAFHAALTPHPREPRNEAPDGA